MFFLSPIKKTGLLGSLTFWETFTFNHHHPNIVNTLVFKTLTLRLSHIENMVFRFIKRIILPFCRFVNLFKPLKLNIVEGI